MKKTFSCVMALFASIMLLVTSCNNASQVTFVDSAKNNYTDDGLSALTIKVGNEPTYRNIWPEDWTEETKSNLLYVLSGTENGGTKKFGILNNTKPGYFDNDGSADVLGTKKQNVFTWDEISHNKAVINLDPIKWDFILTAVQIADSGEFKDKNLTNAKKVLASAVQTVDLTSGAKAETFKLITNLDDKTALGNVDIQVQFFNEDAAKVKGAKFEVIESKGSTDLVNTSNGSDKGNLTSGKGDGAITGSIANVADVILNDKFSVIAGRKLSSIQLAGTLPIGKHQLKVHFYNDAGLEILTYEEPILIEGGNTSRSIIKIPEGQMGKAPEQPIDLQASVAFVPTKGTIVDVVVDGGKKVKAQVLETTGTEPADICKNYNVTFTWKDMSYNETGFRLVLTGVDDTVTVLENTPDNGSGSHATTPIQVVGTDNAKATWFKENSAGITNNSLDGGSQRVVLSLPLTYHLKDAKIYAVNNFVKFDTDNITVKSPTPLKPATLTKHMGMFTVSYCLTTNISDGSTGKKVAKINYNNGTGTTITQTNGSTDNLFVMGYEVGTKTAMVTKVGDLISEVSVPSISLAGSADLKFGKWVQSLDTAIYDSSKVGAGTDITDELLNDELTTSSGATIVSNIVVHPVFVTPFTVKVEFPSYSSYKELNVSPNTADRVENNVIKPKTADGKIILTALKTAPSIGGTISGWKFTVNTAGGVGDVLAQTGTVGETNKGQYGKFTVADNVLTWDTTTATAGGNYTIYVEYDHTDGDGNIKHIGGTLYVEFSK